ncbi:uncharacterized protein LOC135500235 [Lineus longissimus]|uniref:uncharacterized protein LOC135500235 n=1 Tax=Lineus longissimus TaxID=88925 RepID=UPI002B4EDC9B
MASLITFPIVIGKFRVRKPQFVIFILLTSFVLLFLYLIVPPHVGSAVRTDQSLRKIVDKDVIGPRLPEKSRNVTVTTDSAASLVAKYDESAAFKSVNYTKHLSFLQEKLNKLTQLLKEKTSSLKDRTYDKFVEFGLISKYFHVSAKITRKLPFKWNISRPLLDRLVADKVYYHDLQEAVNKTRAIALKYKPIYDLNPGTCSCRDLNCECCARIFVRRLKVDQQICINFTYVAGNQVLKTNIFYQKQLAFNQTISAKEPPEICMLGTHNLTETCVQFLNITYNVQASEDHKTRLTGCMEFHFNVESKTIASYPVGCFITPKKSDIGNVNKLGNWVV